jgi:hypothetical protein
MVDRPRPELAALVAPDQPNDDRKKKRGDTQTRRKKNGPVDNLNDDRKKKRGDDQMRHKNKGRNTKPADDRPVDASRYAALKLLRALGPRDCDRHLYTDAEKPESSSESRGSWWRSVTLPAERVPQCRNCAEDKRKHDLAIQRAAAEGAPAPPGGPGRARVGARRELHGPGAPERARLRCGASCFWRDWFFPPDRDAPDISIDNI